MSVSLSSVELWASWHTGEVTSEGGWIVECEV
jgi:hypothetical protein